MKLLLILVLTSLSATLQGQNNSLDGSLNEIYDNADKLGNDSLDCLNDFESQYLNLFFQEERGLFSFSRKRVCFFTGNIGSIRICKNRYFSEIKEMLEKKSLPAQGYDQLIIFNKEQADLVKFDAAIISGSKKLITVKSLIRRLK